MSRLLFIGLFLFLAGSRAESSKFGPEASLYPTPSPVPERIVLTFTGDPATTQSVTWRTDADAEEAFAEIAPAGASPEFYKTAIRFEAVSEPFKTDNGPALNHSVRFTGLQPNTLYAYRVGDDDHSSEWFQFRTAQGEPTPFSFLYFGDAQNNILSMWSRTIRAAYSEEPDARFMIHAGDLISSSGDDEEWGEWFGAGSWIFAMLPSIVAVGNHEYGGFMYAGEDKLTDHWRAQFTLPENGPSGLEETAYFVDYDGLRIVVLNSCEELERQADWLAGVLKDNPNRWTIAVFHHPVHSATRDRDNEKMRDHWKPLLEQYGVDLVLQGHDHAYARGHYPSEEKAGKGNPEGPVYVVSVSGPKMYELDPRPWMDRMAEETQHYQVITIEDKKLIYKSYTATGELFDLFEIVKRDNAPARFVDGMQN